MRFMIIVKSMEAVIELRQLIELDEFPHSHALDEFKQMEANQKT